MDRRINYVDVKISTLTNFGNKRWYACRN